MYTNLPIFRGRQVLEDRDGWHLLARRNGQTVLVNPVSTPITWRREVLPICEAFRQFYTLTIQAHSLSLPEPSLRGDQMILVPDWGGGYLWRRTLPGMDAGEDACAYREMLMKLYPSICFLHPNLIDAVYQQNGDACQPDVRDTLITVPAKEKFPTACVYWLHVSDQIEESWNLLHPGIPLPWKC